MDFDYLDNLGLEQDKIKIYLQTKLAEALEENRRLDKAITEREQHLKTAAKEPGNNCKATVEFLWKKVFANKFCLGYSVKIADNAMANKLRAFFHWNGRTEFVYTMFMYTEKLQSFSSENHKLQDLKYITIAFDVPAFTQDSVYEVNSVLYLDEDNSVVLPNVTIAVSDCVDRKTVQWTITDNMMSLLTAMSCCKSSNVMFVLPTTWHSTIDNAFEIYCGLQKLNLDIENRVYYTADKVSTVFDNTVIELHIDDQSQTHISGVIYIANELAISTILHHFMNSVSRLQIYPKEIYDILFMDVDSGKGDCLEKFKNSVIKELEFRTNHLGENKGSLDNIIGLERKVNRLYMKQKMDTEMEI
nr:unnamed protein product [Callosobruchus chinensis]